MPIIGPEFFGLPFEGALGWALLFIMWLPIAAVLIWGLSQWWLNHKQDQYWEKLKWHLLHVTVPADSVQTPKGMVNFFTTIAGSKSSITWKEKWMWGKFQAYFSFEITSTEGRINFYVRTQEKYRDLVEASLYAQYPEAQVTEVEDYVQSLPNDYPNDEYNLFGSEMVLGQDDFLPIKTWDYFEHQGEKDLRFKDPILTILENLGKLKTGEHYWLQILIMQPDEQDWRKAGQKFINEKYGKEEKKKSKDLFGPVSWIPKEIMAQVAGMAFGEGEEAGDKYDWQAFKITSEEKEQIDGVARKISSLGWYAKIRWVYVAKHEVFRKGSIASLSKGIFHQYRHQSLNKLGLHGPSTPKDDYFYMEWQMPAKQRRLMSRFQNRSFGPGSTPYILNCEELATLFHFPPADARTPVLTTVGSRLAEAPIDLQFAGLDEPDLPNLDRSAGDGVGTVAPQLPDDPGPLVVPTPMAPAQQSAPAPAGMSTPQPAPAPVQYSDTVTMQPAPADPQMPQAGMPAPLPPGLSLEDEPVNSQGSPGNLPT